MIFKFAFPFYGTITPLRNLHFGWTSIDTGSDWIAKRYRYVVSGIRKGVQTIVRHYALPIFAQGQGDEGNAEHLFCRCA